jgi:sugar phosphate isomerase/epimerase
MKRRTFIKEAALVGAGISLGTGALAACNNERKKSTVMVADNPEFGIQLWSVRDQMKENPKATLTELASFGYTHIESFEGGDGMFWGMSPKDFKNFLQDLGLRAISTHANVFERLEEKAALAAESGMEYLICPWLGPKDTIDEYKEAADFFAKCTTICEQAGIKFGYHNHDYSFLPLEEMIPQDVLMKNTPDTMMYEMDIYWIVAAKQKPQYWLDKYRGRWHIVHCKDREDLPFDQKDASIELGKGVVDFNLVQRAYAAGEVKYLIVEQERWPKYTPMESAQKNAKYMKELLSGKIIPKW